MELDFRFRFVSPGVGAQPAVDIPHQPTYSVVVVVDQMTLESEAELTKRPSSVTRGAASFREFRLNAFQRNDPPHLREREITHASQ